MSPLERVVEALRAAGCRGQGSDWTCPAHEDRNPSLSVGSGEDGRVLLHCHAGCATDEVVARLGLSMADLMVDRSNRRERRQVDRIYDYTDETGALLFQVVRYVPKAFRQRRPAGDGRWIWNLAGVPRVLYRLPELRAAVGAGQTIYVVEGEKDVETLRRRGLVATCNPGGAARSNQRLKWRAEYSAEFAGASVMVIADRDDAGRAHAAAVAVNLDPVAKTVIVVEPGHGKDVSEMLAMDYDLDDLQRVDWWPPTNPAAVEILAQAGHHEHEDHEHAGDTAGAGGDEEETDAGDQIELPPPTQPVDVAVRFLQHLHESGSMLRSWRGGFWLWQGSHWAEIAHDAVRARLYDFTHRAVYFDPKGGSSPLDLLLGTTPPVKLWAPNRRKIGDLVEAVAALTHLPEGVQPPAWVDGVGPPAGTIVACANGLLHSTSRLLLDHDPRLFNLVGLPFDYRPDSRSPARWLAFLDQIWDGDQDCVDALQEWFGYVISGRTDLHKIALLVGPTRAGKGVIARVLTAMIGRANVAGPTLASLGTNFGLSPLLGKPLAVIADARLGERTNVSSVVERLLSISGEDTLTVDRKYREPWTGQLPSRFLILTNELPRFGDASGAIAHRFIVLTLTQSFLGRENPRLTNELLSELDGILGWSLDGLDRLTARGYLTEPATSTEAVTSLEDLASPVAAFVRDRCKIDPAGEVSVTNLFQAWSDWCIYNSHDRRGTKQTFGRDLRAVAPAVRTARPREGETSRQRRYQGIALRPE